MLRIIFLGADGSAEGFCGRFCGRCLRKVPRKVFAEGLLRKICAEGLRKDSGRIPECSGPSALIFLIRKVSCRRFRGKFLRKVPRKVFAEGSAEGSRKVFRGRFKIRSRA